MKLMPSQEKLKELLEYFPDSGVVRWKERPSNNQWSSRFAGRVAGFRVGVYRYIKLFSESYSIHRVIWKLINGEDPTVIDHINHDQSDNRIENLRNVDWKPNQRNQKSKGKPLGVKKMSSGRWSARIKLSGESKWLGTFDTQEEAVAARTKAEQKYGFSEFHGRDCGEI